MTKEPLGTKATYKMTEENQGSLYWQYLWYESAWRGQGNFLNRYPTLLLLCPL